jgi:hypothetical protein
VHVDFVAREIDIYRQIPLILGGHFLVPPEPRLMLQLGS